jgi:hypothetical protein
MFVSIAFMTSPCVQLFGAKSMMMMLCVPGKIHPSSSAGGELSRLFFRG